ncbi:MAG: protein-glutamate O-methyltransferase [Aliishimia sp.]
MKPETDPRPVDHGFNALSKLAYQEAGLVLAPSKSAMIQSRLRHRLKVLGIGNILDYCQYVSSHEGKSEKVEMISALTTNVSSFFREPHHFDFLKEELLDTFLERVEHGEPIRLWSAGCSNGQEPYSLAILLTKHSEKFTKENCKILATDIDKKVLRFAQEGRYEEGQIGGLAETDLHQFFKIEKSISGTKNFAVIDKIKDLVTFKPLNLIEKWPMKGSFDVIFCRNVIIYFDAITQDQLWPRFHNILKDDGIFFVGHSERINSDKFSSAGATAYRKMEENKTQINFSPEETV